MYFIWRIHCSTSQHCQTNYNWKSRANWIGLSKICISTFRCLFDDTYRIMISTVAPWRWTKNPCLAFSLWDNKKSNSNKNFKWINKKHGRKERAENISFWATISKWKLVQLINSQRSVPMKLFDWIHICSTDSIHNSTVCLNAKLIHSNAQHWIIV